jgi:pantetheine-phosphate adenylyltransferase
MKKEKKTIAIFPGTFDPFTVGHLNILEKAEAIFGKENVIVAVLSNPAKVSRETLSTIKDYSDLSKKLIFENIRDTGVNMLKAQLPSKNIEGHFGMLTNYLQSKEDEGFEVILIRGLRNSVDFDYEYTQSRYMWDQKPNVKVVYIPCDPLYTHISSSGYKALEIVEKGSGYHYLARETQENK